MIKLNNKNITYVALADTNNSIKAPKEIWYADTNNSVKLVYRRKDALIEGEDYEKYHWLRAEMPLNKLLMALSINSNNVDFYIKRLSLGNITILITNGYKYFFWNNAYEIGSFGNGADVEHYPYSSDTQLFHIVTNSTNVLINDIQFNSVGFPIRSINFITEPAGNEGVTLTSTISVDEIERYIPCKLLKPVPKWLDANGIRRQIGECGMIDLVSGKFYGNVNSVGTFTVENYYEKKEWLVGDGSAYIDTLHLANEGLNWETHVSNLSFKKYFVWNRVATREAPSITLYHSVVYNGTVKVQNNYTNSIELQNQTNYDYIVATNSNGTVINGVQYIMQSMSENISNKSIKLFYCDIDEFSKTTTVIVNGGNSQDVCCAYFRFLDSNRDYIQNLIPCTLTMDLPASMDANNIARTKGTSGMWDLVSDRFYGNVASSGTFKAVNLAEGVDYEVHQWLKGDGTAYIDTNRNALSGDSVSFNFKVASDDMPNDKFVFGTREGYREYFLYQNINSLCFSIGYRNGDGALKYIGTGIRYDAQSIYSYTHEINSKSITTSINNTIYSNSITLYDVTSCHRYLFTTLGGNYNYDGYMGEYVVKNNNSIFLSLTPVRLLRSIPSKYDANGIARQAGECGMYDTVNDKFYGNVASSGSFTVSDDN